jgi:hypothetical protein
MSDERFQHLIRFYSIFDKLERKIGGARRLKECSRLMDWPSRGVYFFHEAAENRTQSGYGARIVRVGTHALKAASGTKLWTRLSQHKGQSNLGGNNRGSIFRQIVGAALINRHGYDCPTWGVGNTAKNDLRRREHFIECEVSGTIGNMPFLWLTIDDEAGPDSLRGCIERNSIGLLSNYRRSPLDPPSHDWLGRHCNRERVRGAGLWNSNHVDNQYDPAFLDILERLVSPMGRAS